MALTLPNRYPGRFNPPSAEYPQGSFKNRTAPGALDGSYLEQDWANDKEGFFQSLIAAAGLTPSDIPDEVGSSQYYDALLAVIAGEVSIPDATETVKGVVELATTTEAQTGTDTVRAVTPAGLLAAINALSLGRGQTYQNVTGSRNSGVTYTNTTSRPISVEISVLTSAAVETATIVVGGVTVYSDDPGTSGLVALLSFNVPPGSTYSVTLVTSTINRWVELR